VAGSAKRSIPASPARESRRLLTLTSGHDAGINNRERRTGMALKVELKPNECIIIGNCVVTNTEQRARLLIDGDNVPILREKDIMTPATADTPAKLVYLAVQLMYLSPNPEVNHGTYFSLLRDIVTAAPSTWRASSRIMLLRCVLVVLGFMVAPAMAQASGTVYAPVGAVRNGKAPNKLPSKTKRAMEPTMGM